MRTESLRLYGDRRIVALRCQGWNLRRGLRLRPLYRGGCCRALETPRLRAKISLSPRLHFRLCDHSSSVFWCMTALLGEALLINSYFDARMFLIFRARIRTLSSAKCSPAASTSANRLENRGEFRVRAMVQCWQRMR